MPVNLLTSLSELRTYTKIIDQELTRLAKGGEPPAPLSKILAIDLLLAEMETARAAMRATLN